MNWPTHMDNGFCRAAPGYVGTANDDINKKLKV